VESNSIGADGSSAHQSYSGPTSTEADKAVEFVYDQLGCPYVYGATGPCNDGFELLRTGPGRVGVRGVSIPRDTYEQWAALPHISVSRLSRVT